VTAGGASPDDSEAHAMPEDRHHPPRPRVSVVIPTFNRAARIVEAVESIRAQSYRDFEIIVVDDGSTDETPRIVPDRFGFDPRVRYARRANGGPAAARNDGIRQARGDLIAFLDSDDLWDPEKLRIQVEQLDRNPEAGLSFCDALTEGGRPGAGTRFQSKRFRGDTSMRGIVEWNFPMCTPSVVVRRTVLDAVGTFDESFACNEDWDLWIRIVARYPVVYVDRPLMTIRRGADNLSRTRVLEKWRSGLRLWERHRGLLLRSGCPPRLLNRKLGHAHKKVAQGCHAIGSYREARTHYLRWWLCRPWQVRGLLWWVALAGHRGDGPRKSASVKA
jgi:glycosyltransferase involved in cell wall biosynthesis